MHSAAPPLKRSHATFTRTAQAAVLSGLIPMTAPGLPAKGDAPAPPNILIIQCDDLGVDDLGINNPAVHTPNIDALAAESVRFADFTVNPVCAPSRATLLTGRHFLRTGVSHVHGGKDYLHRDERTLADHLRAAGYATGMWGKWHLGHAEDYFPWQRGFDEAWACDLYRHRDASGLFNGRPVKTASWADTAMADYAIDFIRRNAGRRFFAYLPTMTPHGPLDAPEEWVEFYRKQGHSEALSKLWGMVSALDTQIGRVLNTLDEEDLRNRTVVVFLSDNGPAVEQRSLSDEDRTKRRVSGLRGWKGDLYENGVRSPLFIRWPGHLEPREVTTPTDAVELAPTLLDLAGVRAAEDSPPMDGSSFLARLQGREDPSPAAAIFNYAHRGWLTSGPPYSLDGLPGEYAPVVDGDKRHLGFETQSLSVRRGNFKLLLNPDYRAQGAAAARMLVNVATDPGEQHDLSAKHPELAAKMEAELRVWWEGAKRAPHAFATPVFRLTAGRNEIPARAPCRLRGAVFNQVVELKGWKTPGDLAAYGLRSTDAGTARIGFRWAKGQLPIGTRWRLRIGGTETSVSTDGTTPVELPVPTGPFELELELETTEDATAIPPLRSLEIEWEAAT